MIVIYGGYLCTCMFIEYVHYVSRHVTRTLTLYTVYTKCFDIGANYELCIINVMLYIHKSAHHLLSHDIFITISYMSSYCMPLHCYNIIVLLNVL